MTRSTNCPRSSSALIAGLVLLAGAADMASAQRWQRPVGTQLHEGALDVEYTRDGGSISVGWRYNDAGVPDAFVVKHKRDGSVEWDLEFGGGRPDIAYSVIQTRDDGYAIAFETLNAMPGFELGIYKIDSSGAYMWAMTYPGTWQTDPIHKPYPGPAIEEDANTADLLVTGNISGRPLLLRTDPFGNYLYNRIYTIPGADNLVELAFTDLKVDDESIVISGTGRRTDFAGVTHQDSYLMRTDPLGFPMWANLYDSTNVPDLGVRETGDGLDLRRADAADGMIYLAGRTDLGRAFSPKLGTYLLAVDGLGLPMFDNSLELSPNDQLADDRIESAYAAVRHDAGSRQVYVAGMRARSTTTTAAWAFDDSTALLNWANGYNRLSEGEGVDIDKKHCGPVVAGVIDSSPWPNGNGGLDIHHVKLNASGDSGCQQTRLNPRQDPPRFRPEPVQLSIEEFQEQVDFDFPPRPVGSGDAPFCYSAFCNPCPIDFDGDGLLTTNDFFAFLVLYQNADPAADLFADGVINTNDFFAFLAAYQAGCS